VVSRVGLFCLFVLIVAVCDSVVVCLFDASPVLFSCLFFFGPGAFDLNSSSASYLSQACVLSSFVSVLLQPWFCARVFVLVASCCCALRFHTVLYFSFSFTCLCSSVCTCTCTALTVLYHYLEDKLSTSLQYIIQFSTAGGSILELDPVLRITKQLPCDTVLHRTMYVQLYWTVNTGKLPTA
jgi:hypothetical protein